MAIMAVTTVRRREINPQRLLYIPSRDFTLVWPRRVFVDCGARLDSRLWTINTAFLRFNHLITLPTNTCLLYPFLNHYTLFIMPSAKSSGKGKVGGKVKSEDTKSTSRSTRAGLQFPVSRIHRMLRRANVSKRIGSGAPGKLSSCLVFR